MRAIQVTCPQCGAALNVSGGKDDVRCEYCGTNAAVQRRSRVFQIAMPVAATKGPVAYQVRGRRFGVVIAIVTLLLVGGVGLGIFAIVHAVTSTKTVWQGGGPPIADDLDGDGRPELIGRSRSYSPDEIAIVALDLEQGTTRWSSDVIGNYTDTYQGLLGAAGDVVLYVSDRGRATALDRATGKVRWTVALPEKPKALCDGGAGVIVVVTADDVHRGLRTADGQAATVEATETCTPIATDDPPDLDAASGEEEAAGLWDTDALVAPDGTRVLAGQRAKGTRVAQLARVGGWKADLPPDPLAAEEGSPDAAGVSAALACGSWKVKNSQQQHVSCFGLADGARRWDATVDGDAPLEGVSVVGDRVLVSSWGVLEAFDAATGKSVWRFGEAF